MARFRLGNPQLYADIGVNEEFVRELVLELPEILDATLVLGEDREKVRHAILDISLQGLMPAFEGLRQIRNSVGTNLPILNSRKLYEDFAISLWRAYKDLAQVAARLLEPDIGFIYQQDSAFDAGAQKLEAKLGEKARELVDRMRDDRQEWQSDFAEFRNYLEHKDGSDPTRFAKYYTPDEVEDLFDLAWNGIADLLTFLLSLRLPPDTRLVEVAPEHRAGPMERRYRFVVAGFRDIPGM